MKRASLLILLIFLPRVSSADFSVAYTTATGDILEYGYQDFSKYKGNLAFGITTIKESDPILKNPIRLLKFDNLQGKIILKSAAEIDIVEKAKRKVELLQQAEVLTIRALVFVEMGKVGFNVTNQLTTVQTQIAVLKAEYDTLP